MKKLSKQHEPDAPKRKYNKRKSNLENRPVNCLRCKWAQILPHTNLAVATDPTAIMPIYCGKIKRNRPAVLHRPCSIADGRNKSSGGDFSVARTQIEIDFLAMHYPTASIELLMALTMRDWETIKTTQQIHGVCRIQSEAALELRGQRISLARANAALGLNDLQKKYLQERHKAGDWPIAGGYTNPNHPYRIKQNQMKAQIINDVARLGHPFSWKTIVNFVYRTTSPSGIKVEKKRRAKMKGQAKSRRV